MISTQMEVLSIGYNPDGKLVVRAKVVETAQPSAAPKGREFDIATDHLSFAKLAEAGVRVRNDILAKGK